MPLARNIGGSVRILLVDDHPIVRAGLRALLESEGHTVVAEAASGREAVDSVMRDEPDVVLMDVSMPDMNGIEATRRIFEHKPHVKILALSMHTDQRYVAAMLHAGASGYLLKEAAIDDLVDALDCVARGQQFVGGGVSLPPEQRTAAGRALSIREREVLKLLAEGAASKDIALALGIALPTVETHRRQIMKKLGLRSIAELTKWAIREGLTSVE